MGDRKILNPVIALVADVLGSHYYNHTLLNTLFAEAGAPGGPPAGQGNIHARASQDERSGWIFDRIEYSTVADEPERFHWERYWIEEYRRLHGCLPEYNRVGGKRP